MIQNLIRALRWLIARGPRRRIARPAKLYRRDGCSLCDQAESMLQPYVQAGRLQLELIDIERNPDLLRQYCTSIPVLVIESHQRLDWPFDRRNLEQALR